MPTMKQLHSYAFSQSYLAMVELAGDGPLRERLAKAFRPFLAVKEDQRPSAALADYRAFRPRITAIESDAKGSIEATLTAV